MAAEDEGVVLVAAFGLGEDVVAVGWVGQYGFLLSSSIWNTDASVMILRCGVANLSLHIEIPDRGLARLDLVDQREAKRLRDAHGRHVRALITGSTQRAGDGAINVVVEDSTDGAGEACVDDLQTEFTSATGYEGDVALDLGWEIGLYPESVLSLSLGLAISLSSSTQSPKRKVIYKGGKGGILPGHNPDWKRRLAEQ